MSYEDNSFIRQIEGDLANDDSFSNVSREQLAEEEAKLRSVIKGMRSKGKSDVEIKEALFPEFSKKRESATKELVSDVLSGRRVEMGPVVDNPSLISRDLACKPFESDVSKLMACRRGFAEGVIFSRSQSRELNESDFEDYKELQLKD